MLNFECITLLQLLGVSHLMVICKILVIVHIKYLFTWEDVNMEVSEEVNLTRDIVKPHAYAHSEASAAHDPPTLQSMITNESGLSGFDL